MTENTENSTYPEIAAGFPGINLESQHGNNPTKEAVQEEIDENA